MNRPSPSVFVPLVLALGITTVIAQIVLLREFLSAFFGNELVIGIVLANWMILTGAGAFAGRIAARKGISAKTILPAVAILGAMPVISVVALRLGRNIVFTAGSMVSIGQICWSSMLLLAPTCVGGGALFTIIANAWSEERGSNLISRTYAFESAGSVLGGIVFNLLLVGRLPDLLCLGALFLLDLAVVIWIALRLGSPRIAIVAAVLIIIVAAVGGIREIDLLSRRFLFPHQEILVSRDTPCGSLVVTQQAGQRNIFENTILLSSSHDVTQDEETAHFPLLQRPDPKEILLISGGLSGIPQEILKYHPRRLDDIEIDPGAADLSLHLSPALRDERVRVTTDDARRYVRTTDRRYDVVIINTAEPVNAQVNRLYTAEFFRDLKRILNPGAVVSIGVLGSVDYLGQNARAVASIVRRTLGETFTFVLVVPGTTREFLLASDSALSIRITALVEQRGIRTVAVNRYYLDDGALARRSSEIETGMDRKAELNEDFHPIAYYKHVLYWLDQFRANLRGPVLVALVLLAILIRRTNAVTFGMMTGGLAAASAEIVLLLAFQVLYGYLYRAAGFIITAFMAGLALGAAARTRVTGRASLKAYAFLQTASGAVLLVLPLLLEGVRHADPGAGVVILFFVLMTTAVGTLVGAQFSMAAAIERSGIPAAASELYGSDLIGAAVGAMGTSVLLVPLLGVAWTCVSIGAVTLLGALVSAVAAWRGQGAVRA